MKPLRSKTVQEMLDISASTLSRMVRRGEIPCVRIGSGKNASVRFMEEALLSWIQRGGCKKVSGAHSRAGSKNGFQKANKMVDSVEKTGNSLILNDGDRSNKPVAE
jgi:excisionase family DNA binding protein